jgi:hypothetical protein
LWRPDSGDVNPASYSQDGDRTIVPLELERNETLFVVFRGELPVASRDVHPQRLSKLADVSGEWAVTFPEGLGAPEHITMPALQSWTESDVPGVRYFSGTATYSSVCDAPDTWFQPGRRLLLSLGDVRDVAEVFVNGKSLGVVWKPPYRIDATSALRTGENRIEVRVTNEWTNRILGDRTAPPDERVLTRTQPGFGFGPQTPVVSGLLGPVQILASE